MNDVLDSKEVEEELFKKIKQMSWWEQRRLGEEFIFAKLGWLMLLLLVTILALLFFIDKDKETLYLGIGTIIIVFLFTWESKLHIKKIKKEILNEMIEKAKRREEN